MRVFRLTRHKYSQEFNGKGAAKSNNRWNSKGVEIIYTAESRALAMAEVVVHLSLSALPDDFMMMEIDIPNSIKIQLLDTKQLDETWNNHPPSSTTQKIGDAFITALDSGVMRVPSAVVQGDYNFLINPYHPNFHLIKVVDLSDFPFDQRLFL